MDNMIYIAVAALLLTGLSVLFFDRRMDKLEDKVERAQEYGDWSQDMIDNIVNELIEQCGVTLPTTVTREVTIRPIPPRGDSL